MHILIIPSENFMIGVNRLGGIFQLHQALAFKQYGNQVGIISVGYKASRDISFIKPKINVEDYKNIKIVRFLKNKFIPVSMLGQKHVSTTFVKMGMEAYEYYVKRFGEPDMIHCHNALHAGLLGKEIFESYKIPFVITEHSSKIVQGLSKIETELSFNAYKSAHEVYTVSKFLKDKLERALEFRFAVDMVVPNLLDPDFLDLKISKNENNLNQIISVGSLNGNKNHALLIEAFAVVCKRYPNLRLVIAGEGADKAKLRNLVVRHGIVNKVEFLGQLDRLTLKQVMSQSCCLVSCSKVETFGVVLIEALSCGLPILCTKSGGPEDIVTDQNGIIVDTNLDALVNGLYQILLERFDSTQIVNDAFKLYGPEAFVEKQLNRFIEILEKESTPNISQ